MHHMEDRHAQSILLGLRKAYSGGHLELQLMQKGHSRRRLDCIDNCSSYRSQVSVHTDTFYHYFLTFYLYFISTVRRLREITEA